MNDVKIPTNFKISWLDRYDMSCNRDVCAVNSEIEDTDLDIVNFSGCHGIACSQCICDRHTIQHLVAMIRRGEL